MRQLLGVRWRDFARFIAFAILFCADLAIVGVLSSSVASAQSAAVAVSKMLCLSSGCGSSSVQTITPGAAAFYKITLDNPGTSPLIVDLNDALPSGFVLAGVTCGPNQSNAIPVTFSGNAVANISLPPGGHVECYFTGAFNGPPVSSASNTASVSDHTSHATHGTSNPVNTAVNFTP